MKWSVNISQATEYNSNNKGKSYNDYSLQGIVIP